MSSTLLAEGPLEALGPDVRARLLTRAPTDPGALIESVSELLALVRTDGDAALRDCARRLDGVDLESLEVPRETWETALASVDRDVRAGLERAAANIRAFHEAQIPEEIVVEVEPGIRLGRRFTPLARAGVYAPGGRAAYPSSLLMGVVPARAAGVGEVLVCSPPGKDGLPSTVVMAAAAIAGADRLFAIGGAGAIGAMAFGTESVPKCDGIVGPGNRWVTEAKRQVAGSVVIDSPAGPSEVLVLAEDGSVPPHLLASELLAQAEHDPDAASVLLTTSARLLEEVRTALTEAVATSPRRAVVQAALATNGALLLAPDRDSMFEFAEAYAPEHLCLCTGTPAEDLGRITTAGTVFLGGSSSVAFGDYMTGANHILPTAGAARTFSGLGALTFLRSFTWQEVSPRAAGGLAEPVAVLAEAEGLFAHAAAARARKVAR